MLEIIDRIFDFWEKDIPTHYNASVIRPSQVQMSFDIADFLHPNNKSKVMLIDAPVGTGKSLGALFPSLLRLYSGKQIIYATSTINLQGQLIREEVPILKKHRLVNNVVLAKGKSHYFCYEQYIKNRSKVDENLGAVLFDFYSSTNTGHRDDLEKVYKSMSDCEWDKISLVCPKHECSNCKYSVTCPTYKHRSRFLSPDNELIITNHNQLIQSYLNYISNKSYILPPNPGIIIIDEAHDFLDNYLGQIKTSINILSLKHLERKVCDKHRFVYKKIVSTLIHSINERKSSLESLQGRYKVEEIIEKLLSDIREYINESLIVEISKNSRFRNMNGKNDDDELSDTLESIDDILSPDNVSWINYEEECIYSINKKFINDFSRFIKQLSINNKIIFMSGTLIANNNFDYLINLWKLDSNQIITEIYQTPFDYKKQAIMYVPKGLVNATKENQVEYIDNQLERTKELLNLTAGKTLILTTSKMHMKNMHLGLSELLAEKQTNLYIQGSSSVESLSQQFKDDINSVLIGSGSFFSGISVKGPSLVSVIVSKLPFAVPDDPFFELLGEEYDDTDKFEMLYIPNMLIKLKQAVGRLIRDINDYGVISILDKRVFDKKYGVLVRTTFEELGYNITRSFEDIELFYKMMSGNIIKSEYLAYQRDNIFISENIKRENGLTKKTLVLNDKKLQLINQRSNLKELKDKNKYYERTIRSQLTDVKANTYVTKEQDDFARFALKEYNIKSTKIDSIDDSYGLYKYLYDLFYKNLYNLKIITNNFPYTDEEQKSVFMKYKGKANIKSRKSPVKEYFITKEELAKY